MKIEKKTKKKQDNFVWIQQSSTTGFMSDLLLSAPQKAVKPKKEH